MGAASHHADTSYHHAISVSLTHLIGRIVPLRVRVVPALIALAALVAWLDASTWRITLLVFVCIVAILGATISAWQTRIHGVDDSSIARNILVMWSLQLCMIIATGGLGSPMLPILVPLGMVGALLDGRIKAVATIICFQLTFIFGLLVFQTMHWLPPLHIPQLTETEPTRASLVFSATIMGLVITVSGIASLALRRLFDNIASEAMQARDEQRVLWEESARDSQRMTAEIAHELKNPLSAIKGLTALVAREPVSQPTAQRITVLTTEIDRMQAILEEFLTFARPIAPLSCTQSSVASLVRHALSIHEAAAMRLDIRLSAVGPDQVICTFDRRKMLQVLVNLIQNALECLPAPTLITLQWSVIQDHVVIEVVDNGPGFGSLSLADARTPGLTTKIDGSGLGLAIAHAIVTQHRGVLSIHAPSSGGACVRISLPLHAPSPPHPAS